MLSLRHDVVTCNLILRKTQERAATMLLNQVLPLVNPFHRFHPIRGKEVAIYSLDVYTFCLFNPVDLKGMGLLSKQVADDIFLFV